jgi:hypothetical protein
MQQIVMDALDRCIQPGIRRMVSSIHEMRALAATIDAALSRQREPASDRIA